MKHLSIASLFACSLLIVLLDLISPSTGCHKSKPYTRPTSIGRPILGLNVQTQDPVSVGDTWAELGGLIVSTNASIINNITNYGIEYKAADDTNNLYKKVKASQLQDNGFRVRLTELKSATQYNFRAYFNYNLQEFKGSTKSFQTK